MRAESVSSVEQMQGLTTKVFDDSLKPESPQAPWDPELIINAAEHETLH